MGALHKQDLEKQLAAWTAVKSKVQKIFDTTA